MGWGVSHHQPDVAPELGALDPVFRLPSRHSQGDLYYQRGRVVEYELAQGDQNQGIVPQPGSRYETAVSGSGAHRQEVDYAGAELEGRLAALLDSARRPRTESRVGVNRHSMKNRKKNISGMGALPPNPRDLSLSRQDSWTGRRAAARHLGIPAPESALGLRLRRALPSAQVRSVYQGRVYKSLAVYTKNLTRPGAPSPPAQIRTCGITAYGSYLGCLTSKRTFGCGCRILALGIHRPTNDRNRAQIIRSRWLRRRSARYQCQIT